MTTDGGGLVAERLQRSIIELRKVGTSDTSPLSLPWPASAVLHAMCIREYAPMRRFLCL